MKYAIVMAAGVGSRMQSKHHKVVAPFFGKPLINNLLTTLRQCEFNEIYAVLGHQGDEVSAVIDDDIFVCYQLPKQLGTADAIKRVDELKNRDGVTLIVSGDVVAISQESINEILEFKRDYDCVVVSMLLDDGAKYGRIIRDHDGSVLKIVEAKDASASELLVNEVNSGIYCIDNRLLFDYLPLINNDNVAGEYYLTDIIDLMVKNNKRVGCYCLKNANEGRGVNTKMELITLERDLKLEINRYWMSQGVIIIDENNTTISMHAKLSKDVVIYPNTYIVGCSVIGEGSIIKPNSYIEDSVIGNDCLIESSKIIDSIIDNNVTIGPFAHIRGHSQIASGCRIGNFVELKNTIMSNNSKCSHLSYLGDCDVGCGVNIGCGVVTVNYNGAEKFRTIINDRAFIGSNVNLVAPIEIGAGAVVAAGSTLSKSVDADDLVIERSEVCVKKQGGFAYIEKNKMRKEGK